MPSSIKSQYLQRALFQGGYHVISLASPAEPEFVVAASSTGIAGRPQDDARDLYRVMQLAYEQVKDRIQVEAFHLLGYSMGAWNAAFVAHLDAQEKVLDFDKVLLINPPVSLYTSAQILDKMLDDNIPGGSGNIGVLLGGLINQFAGYYQQSDDLNFSSDYLLYNLYTRLQPSEAGAGSADRPGLPVHIGESHVHLRCHDQFRPDRAQEPASLARRARSPSISRPASG